MIVKTADILRMTDEEIDSKELKSLHPVFYKLKLFTIIAKEIDISYRMVSYIITGQRQSPIYREEVNKVSRQKLKEKIAEMRKEREEL